VDWKEPEKNYHGSPDITLIVLKYPPFIELISFTPLVQKKWFGIIR
jgi:hypothetical protein